jgi:hypothetical protein
VKIGVISSRDTALKLVTQLSERGHAASAYDVETRLSTSWDAFDAVLTLVGDDRVLTNIVLGKDGLRDRLPVSAIHVAMGMHGVESTRQLAAAHVAAGQSFVAAPLLVPTTSSADSRLAVAAGPQAALNLAVSDLRCARHHGLSTPVTHLKPRPPSPLLISHWSPVQCKVPLKPSPWSASTMSRLR